MSKGLLKTFFLVSLGLNLFFIKMWAPKKAPAKKTDHISVQSSSILRHKSSREVHKTIKEKAKLNHRSPAINKKDNQELEDDSFDTRFAEGLEFNSDEDPWFHFLEEQLLFEKGLAPETLEAYRKISNEFQQKSAQFFDFEENSEEQTLSDYRGNLKFYEMLDRYHKKLKAKLGEAPYQAYEAARKRFNKEANRVVKNGEPAFLILL